MNEDIIIQRGFSSEHLSEAAVLYDAAFGAKYGIGIPDTPTRLAYLEKTLCPEYAISAMRNGQLLGMTGWKTKEGSFTGGASYKVLRHHLGWFRAIRAILILSLFQRSLTPGELLMDGICVSPDARGQGIGTKLLHAVLQLAEEEGYTSVRLDVIDTNPKAKQLYERVGFVEVRTERFSYLKWLLKFSAATQMEYRLEDEGITVPETPSMSSE